MYSKNKIKFFKKIGFKITLWYLLSVLIIIGIVGSYLYYSLDLKLNRQVNTLLKDQVEDILHPTKKLNLNDLNTAIKRETSYRKIHKISARLIDTEKKVVVTSPNFFDPPLTISSKSIAAAQNGNEIIETIRIKNNNNCYRLLTKPIEYDGSLKYFLQIAIYLEDTYKTLDHFKQRILILIPGVIVITIIGGWFISRKSLAPINHIINSSKSITSENLDARLNPVHTGDELEQLTKTINLMLERIEKSFKKNVQFTSDASHELRTPITGLKAGTEVILSKGRSAEEYRELHENNLIVFEGLTRMIDDMFLLSRSDSSLGELKSSTFLLNGLLNELHATFSLLSELKNINFTVKSSNPVKICGDRALLKRSLSNIIDNSIKYTPSGRNVCLYFEEKNDNVAIYVEDNGTGISDKYKDRIFDRFFRVDLSRTRWTGGAGLGLSICKDIIDFHHGKIEVKSKIGEGSTFIVTLPKKQ